MDELCTIVLAKTPEMILTSNDEAKSQGVIIGYWDICGLGQCPRYALELTGVQYTDVRIEPGKADSPTYKDVWFTKKPKLVGTEMKFPNLPYLVDGDVHLSQSNTILRYIARKYGLMGNAYNAHLVDLVLDQATDLDNVVTGACYGDFESLKKNFPDLGNWERFIGFKRFMTGNLITIADLKVYEVIRKLKIIAEQPGFDRAGFLEKDFPLLAGFVARVEALPKMKAYQSSKRFMERPLNNPHAKFR